MEAFLLASTPLFAAGKREDKIETPLRGAASQHLELKGFHSQLLGRGYFAKAKSEELLEQEAAPLHLPQLHKNNSKALLTEGKERRWFKLIIIDHYFPPI